MKTYIGLAGAILIPALLFSQAEKKEEKKEGKSKGSPVIMTNIPALSQYSNNFTIRDVFFNKVNDYSGKGEMLEVEFRINNRTDDPMDLYIFTIATFEKVEKTKSSREAPIPVRERVRTFVACPDDMSNFSYPVTDEQGNVRKDKDGKDMVKLVKFPKNPKAGVNPSTGKPFHLVNTLFIRNVHLSKYRVNYFFFNNVAILVFDSEGKPVFRQLYQIKGKRNR